MARLELTGPEGLAHRYPGSAEWAVQPATLVFENGGAYALLGPSGCGKTTLLNILSGLLKPTQGQVLLDGRDVTAEPPHRRNIAQVFQFPIVYGSMTVFENLAFPLRNRRVPGAEATARVREIAKLLELDGELTRRADSLPAHRKQTLSLGRGLVRRDVAAILLDEPLTVVDPQLKWALRRQLKAVHQQLAVTLVYVTHDQTEALTFADRVIVMNAGRVVQQGTPRELFEDPADPFVGRFIGSPGMNFVPHGTLQLLGIRPEFIRIAKASDAGAIRVDVIEVQDLGATRLVTARLGSELIRARVEDPAIPLGEAWLHFPPERVRMFTA